VKNRDPWATYLQVSVAKEGNVLEQKKFCSPSWEALREFRWVVFFSPTSAPSAVHSSIQGHLSPGSTPSPPWWVWLKKGIREGGSGSHPAQSSAKPPESPLAWGNLQWVLVPSTKSVHNQRNENDSLCLASFTVFPHFDIEGMLDSVFFLTGDLSSKLLLKGSILAQRESRTSAGRSSLPGRSPAGSFRGPRASWDAAEEASTWLAPPHEAETFSGSNSRS